MVERKRVARTPREHFRRAAEDELEKSVRKEIAFQRAERTERERELRLPSLGVAGAPGQNGTRT